MKFEKKYIIQKSLEEVKDIFYNLEKFGSFHPLIKSVKKLDTDVNGQTKYLIKEQPYPWIPIRIKYTALVGIQGNRIAYKIHGIPMVKPSIKYQFSSISNAKTQVHFNLDIEGKMMGKRILMSKMVKAQNSLILLINKEDF